MHCLLYEAVKDGGNTQRPCASSRFGNLYFPNRLRAIRSRQQSFFDARPALLQVALQGRYRHIIHAGGSLVAYHSRVGRHHVAATDNLLHQSRCRFRPGATLPSRDAWRTRPGHSRFLTATLRAGVGCLTPTFCSSCRHRNLRLLSACFMFGPLSVG